MADLTSVERFLLDWHREMYLLPPEARLAATAKLVSDLFHILEAADDWKDLEKHFAISLRERERRLS